MNSDDDTQKSDLDFSQLDQEINQLMQKKPIDAKDADSTYDAAEPNNEIQDTDTWPAIANQLKPETKNDEASTKSIETEQTIKPVRPQKPRGYAMDVIHPSQGLARPKPAQIYNHQKPQEPQNLAQDQKDLPVGDDYLISANASPDKQASQPDDEPKKTVSGYGAGSFSVNESEQIEQKLEQAPTILTEKKAFEKEINKFEDSPIAEADQSVDRPEHMPATDPENGALPANNLVKQSQDDELAKTNEKSSMFDTKEYVQPLKPPIKAKKSSEKFWVIILILLIIVLIGLGAGYYLLILGH